MTLRKRCIKNTIPLYVSKDLMSYSTDEDEDDDYGYFCTENENEDEEEYKNECTQVVWKQYDENNHPCVFQQKYNNSYTASHSDIESIYRDTTDSVGELQSQFSFKNSMTSVYICILRLFYCVISYVSIFVYKVKP